MTQDEIIEMAKQAGFFVKDREAYSPSIQEDHEITPFLRTFAKLVAAKALAQTQEPVAHWSDCSVNSEPAYPKGECDCGGIVAVADYTALSDKYVALSDKYVALKAQRTWVGLTDEEENEYNYLGPDMHWVIQEIVAILKDKNT